MINKINKYQKVLITSFILIYSVLFILFITNSSEPFLQDDNGLQWNPVIENAFSEFFKTGHIPQYNFYQLKGYDIYQVGYYGLYNPLMYFSFFISRLVCTNTMFIYAVISFILGNLIAYKLCISMKNSRSLALIIMLLYSTSAVYFYYSYWYYAFENYWIIPLFFLLFMNSKKRGHKKDYFIYGLFLALSIYLGNIQYSIYHWLLVGMIMLLIMIANDQSYWKKILSNYVIAIILSAPALVGLMRASMSSELYSQKNTEFFYGDVSFLQYINENVFNRGKNIFLFFEKKA